MHSIKDLRKPQCAVELGRELIALHHIFGVDTSRRGNLSYMGDNIIIYAMANSVVFDNVLTHKCSYLMAIDEAGIGCIAVHPSRFVH